MFGTNVTLITRDWDFKGTIKCTSIPNRGEYIFLSDFDKYVMVVNVVHQTKFWGGTKIVLIVEDITTNLPIKKKKSEK